MNDTKVQDGINTSLGWVELNKMIVEYNPKRFNLYASLFDFTDTDLIRLMTLSPMYTFIKQYSECKKMGEKFSYINTKYYNMQMLYGRTHSYAVSKASNFMKLFDDISVNGIQKYPLVEPEFKKFQIRDGHHRIACCMALDYKKLICRIIQGQTL